MGTVIPFPSREDATAIRIPLYGEDEVNFTVGVINMFGQSVARLHPLWFHPGNATTKNLRAFSPHFVIECLKLALASGLFSHKGRTVLEKILASVEEVPLTKEG